MKKFIGFIDGRKIVIAGSDDENMKNLVYNGHKRKQIITYQEITKPDGSVLHTSGKLEGRQHDWKLYFRSKNKNKQLKQILLNDGKECCVYGVSGSR